MDAVQSDRADRDAFGYWRLILGGKRLRRKRAAVPRRSLGAVTMAVLAIGISCMASGIVSTDPATAVLIPHTSDPDCVEYTSPQNGAIVEICATPSGLTFAYANERPSTWRSSTGRIRN